MCNPWGLFYLALFIHDSSGLRNCLIVYVCLLEVLENQLSCSMKNSDLARLKIIQLLF